MNEKNPLTIRFPFQIADGIAKDLLREAFSVPTRPKRSDAYKQGVYAGAFDVLWERDDASPHIVPPGEEGSTELDAWLSGYEEGKLAATAFQISYLEGEASLELVFRSPPTSDAPTPPDDPPVELTGL